MVKRVFIAVSSPQTKETLRLRFQFRAFPPFLSDALLEWLTPTPSRPPDPQQRTRSF